MTAFAIDWLLRATALLAAALLATALLRKQSAALRHAVLLSSLLGLLLLPALALTLPAWRVLPAWAVSTSADTVPTPAAVTVVAPPAPTMPTGASAESPPPAQAAPAEPPVIAPAARTELPWTTLVCGLYLAGAAAALLPVLLGLIGLRRLSRLPAAPAPWHALARAVAADLGLRRPVRVVTGLPGAMPMTWGVRRAWLLLPADAADWSADRRRCVLLHELAHVKRRDFLTLTLARVACAVYWVHPLAWLAAARLRAEAEGACDDLVVTAGTRASVYAEELFTLATASRPARRTAALAMARPGRRGRGAASLRARLAAILDAARDRRRVPRRTAFVCAAVAVAGVLTLAVCRAQTGPATPAPKAVAAWAKAHNFAAGDIAPTTLEGRFGKGWRNLPFALDPAEEADVTACAKLAVTGLDVINGRPSPDPATRDALQAILSRRPNFFYAEFLLAQWLRDAGDAAAATKLLDAAYAHAPAVIVQRYERPDGTPLANTAISSFSLECNRVQNGSLDPSLHLLYTHLRTDAAGCIYLPAYQTVFRTDRMASPSGYDVAWPRLGWFETRQKVGLLPAATATPKRGNFTTAAATAPSPVNTLSDGTHVDLLAVSAYPNPANRWWKADGAPTDPVAAEPPGLSPLPDDGRQFAFRFSKALPPDAHMTYQFSAYTSAVNGYTTVRDQDLQKPYLLFAAFPTRPAQVTVRLGVASGPWRTVVDYTPATDEAVGELPDGYSFSVSPYDALEGLAVAQVTLHRRPAADQLRVLAVTTDGREIAGQQSSFSRHDPGDPQKERVDETYAFLIPSAQIKSLRLQSRRYEWLEFRDVALEPAHGNTQPATSAPATRPAVISVPATQSALSPAANQAYTLAPAPRFLYRPTVADGGPSAVAAGAAWETANEFVFRTALRTAYRLPADATEPEPDGHYLVTFSPLAPDAPYLQLRLSPDRTVIHVLPDPFAAMLQYALAAPVVRTRPAGTADEQPTGIPYDTLLAGHPESHALADFPKEVARWTPTIDALAKGQKLWSLCALLDHPHPDVKIQAARALKALHDPRAMPALLAAAKANAYDVSGSENATLHRFYRSILKHGLETLSGKPLTPPGLTTFTGDPPRTITSQASPEAFPSDIDFDALHAWLIAQYRPSATRVP
jgi:beta-lactamase regulating signal transducer with metallopeptidase domain